MKKNIYSTRPWLMLQQKAVGPMSEKQKASVDSAEIYKLLWNCNADWEAIFREAENEAGNCLFYSPKWTHGNGKQVVDGRLSAGKQDQCYKCYLGMLLLNCNIPSLKLENLISEQFDCTTDQKPKKPNTESCTASLFFFYWLRPPQVFYVSGCNMTCLPHFCYISKLGRKALAWL